ncbi:MAG TPA: hypothetical protein VG844_11470 [Terracidiphilus sp.]|nr:hypothetical protein [Terracidiphilus sp.]
MPDIYWIHPVKGVPRPTLAIVERPRSGKLLAQDLAEFRAAGIKILVSLLPEDEAEYLGLADEEKIAQSLGIEFVSFPLSDHRTPPDRGVFRKFAMSIATRVFDHEAVAIHCRGSIGRSTLVAACTLIHLGWTPAHALLDISSARGCPVPDTEKQQAWILRYKAEP